MVSIIIAGHGKFPEGILNAAEMILGKQENTETVSLLPEEGPEDLKRKINAAIDKLGKKAVILLDFWGGTPFNVSSKIFEERKDEVDLALLTGTSMPILVEALGGKDGYDDPKKFVKYLLSVAPDAVKSYPEIKVAAKSGAGAKAPAKAKKVDTKPQFAADSFLDIEFIRSDSRLLHGQVAMAWSRQISPDRILVVSDTVAHDKIRKGLLAGAVPAGIKVNVITRDKFVDIYHDPRFKKERLMVVFEDVVDLQYCCEKIGDAKFKNGINIGTIAHKEGNTRISKAISISSEQVEAIKKLVEAGHKVYHAQTPPDAHEDMLSMLKSKGL